MRLVSTLAVAFLGSTLVACFNGQPEAGPEAASTNATAIVSVERTAGPGEAVKPDAVSARFIRVRQGSVDDPALRIAGVAEDLPALGTCAVPTANPTAGIQGRSVELLDVGDVTLTPVTSASSPALDARVTMLSPRTMPDPAGVVRGVFYSSRSTEAFAAGAPVALRAVGGADLEPFSMTVSTPRDLGEVHVISVAGGLDVWWDATDADAHDLVYVDVLSTAPRSIARCTSVDAGHFLIPAASVTIDEGQVAVHRLHKEPFTAKGISPGEIRFDLAKIVTFRR